MPTATTRENTITKESLAAMTSYVIGRAAADPKLRSDLAKGVSIHSEGQAYKSVAAVYEHCVPGHKLSELGSWSTNLVRALALVARHARIVPQPKVADGQKREYAPRLAEVLGRSLNNSDQAAKQATSLMSLDVDPATQVIDMLITRAKIGKTRVDWAQLVTTIMYWRNPTNRRSFVFDFHAS